MKEKETVTCPICGGTLQVQGQALFKEHHEQLWKEEVRDCSLYCVLADKYRDSFGRLSYSERGRSFEYDTNKPSRLIAWEQQNPIPSLDLIGFVVTLAKRVADLEEKSNNAPTETPKKKGWL